MLNSIFKSVLSSSSARAKFFTQYFAVFASVYHIVFIVLFKIYNVTPMFYMNFYSVPFFIFIAYLTPKLNSYVWLYLWACLEVYTHQTLGIVTMGSESSFHFFFIPFALLPLYTFKNKFKLAIALSIFGGAVFFGLHVMSSHFTPLYQVPPAILSFTKITNVLLAVTIILSSVFIFTYIAWTSEHNLEKKVLTQSIEVLNKENEVKTIQAHTIHSLTFLAENRDLETGEHLQRTSALVELIARGALKNGLYPEIITEAFIERIKRAAPMHDIGKIVVADTVLKKEGSLTEEEFEAMKKHTTEGAKIVKDVIGLTKDSEFVAIAQEVALSHHEHWEGSGYPQGLRENEIPVSARIMALADVYDALISKRRYKDAVSEEEALNLIQQESGRQFDPALVEIFIRQLTA